MSEDVNDEPDLLDAEEELERLVRYFEEVEKRLEAQSDAPVHLVETRSAWRASVAIARFLGAERDRNRAWKHSEPSGVAREFIGLVAEFVKEKRLSWEELAGQLHLESRSFVRLADFADEEPGEADEPEAGALPAAGRLSTRWRAKEPERQEALGRAAAQIREGDLDIVSPEELADLRRGVADVFRKADEFVERELNQGDDE
jgi:hypothetical protein